jgi:hypothetical protein
MSIACALGIVACLNYKDTTVDWEDAWDIVEVCTWLYPSPANSFMGPTGRAYLQAEMLWDLGLRFEWNPPNKTNEQHRMQFRKNSVVRECNHFTSLYQNINNWENPKKKL